jgi:hypothetical protein
MPKSIIKLRKRFILPKRWRREEKRQALLIELPVEEQLIKLKQELDRHSVLAHRKNNTMKKERMEAVSEFCDALIHNRFDAYLKDL